VAATHGALIRLGWNINQTKMLFVFIALADMRLKGV